MPFSQASAKKTILMVSHASCLGGAERSLVECAVALDRETEFTPCISCPGPDALSEEVLRRGLKWEALSVVAIEGIRSWSGRTVSAWNALGTAKRLWSTARRTRACLIHANGVKACIPALIAARLARIPCVWHVRDFPRHGFLTRTLRRHAQATIVSSRFLCDAVRRYDGLNDRLLAVIPNGVEPPSVHGAGVPVLKEQLRIDPGALVVTMVAQIVPWKRHDLFLEAAALACRERTNRHFLLVGADLWGRNTDYEGRIRRRAQAEDLAGSVSFLGQREDVGTILAASDVTVLPSDNEPFGRVVIESWHAGTPVIVSDNGGPAEIVEDGVTGLHFRHGDPGSLARAIGRLASSRELRRKLAEAGKAQAAHYSASEHGRAVAGVFRELLA